MNQEKIIITNVLNKTQKEEVAKIFYNSFTKKLSHLWLFAKNTQQALKCLVKCIKYKNGLYAIRNRTVLGFVGLEFGKENYTDFKFNILKKVFGFLGAIWRYIAYKIYRLFHDHVNKNEVHIDPIAVSQEARGKGIGSMLIDASFKYAKTLGKRKVVLEVVDTNPHAQRLYKRLGFLVTKREYFGRLTSRAGFREVIHMSKELE